MSEIEKIIKNLIEFRDARDWQKFHSSKDLAIAISIESAELLELFLWQPNEDINKDRLKDELADVLSYCLLLAEKQGFNISEIVEQKIKKNELKYPVGKSKGNSTKYTDFK